MNGKTALVKDIIFFAEVRQFSICPAIFVFLLSLTHISHIKELGESFRKFSEWAFMVANFFDNVCFNFQC